MSRQTTSRAKVEQIEQIIADDIKFSRPPRKAWRMPKKCPDCPFASRGPGLRLRNSLRPGRWAQILSGLADGEYFHCHQTTRDTDNDDGEMDVSKALVCAGSIEWQDKNGYSSAYVRICRRLDQSERERHEPKQKSRRLAIRS